MKKRAVFSIAVTAALILLAGLLGCRMPGEPANAAPSDALSYEQLLANLDALEGQAARGLALPGRGLLGAQDLSTYLGAIKKDLAAYVYARAGGSPYLVLPRKLTWSTPKGPESGLMWVPFTWGRSLPAPIISFQHGTQVYGECAPSRFNANPLAVLSSPDLTGALQNYVECIVGALMASAGYIVVMPDYVGFGDSTLLDHPYVHMSLGGSVHGVIGAAKAALKYSAVKPNEKIFLTGYSEGGYATMAGARALQLANIRVNAIVPCDGAYDLSGVMLTQMLTGTNVKVPSYLLYTVSGYHAAYGGAVNYGQLLKTDYANLLTGGLFDGTHTNAQVAGLPLPTTPSQMLMGDAIGNLLAPGMPVFNLLAANNGWVGWMPTAPVVLVHCQTDDVVPYQNALNALAVLGPMLPPGLVRIVDVPPIPLIATVMGSIHVAAFPTAMLAAFTAIETVNRGY